MEAAPDLDGLRARAYAAMNDDFNTPILIAVLYDAVKAINSVAAGRMALDAAGIDALRACSRTSPRTSSASSTKATIRVGTTTAPMA